MDQVKTESLAEDRYTMVLFASFAALAWLLAAVGIYGLMAFAVSQRTNEIGLPPRAGREPGKCDLADSRGGLTAGDDRAGDWPVGLRAGRADHANTLYGVGAMDFSVIFRSPNSVICHSPAGVVFACTAGGYIDPMAALRSE